MAVAPQYISDSWRAELDLRFEHRLGKTVLAHRKHVGPLVVQRPFYPEGAPCHVYLVHPPGGIAGGDTVSLNARAGVGAHAVITTPAATKFYRSLPDRRALLQQALLVDDDAAIEWLPQDTIVFRDADATMTTVARLARGARFVGWEVTCYGRPACGEVFDRGRIQQNFEVWIDDRPTLLDHLRIDGAAAMMNSAWGLSGQCVVGTLFAYPATSDELDAARETDGVACTLVDGVLACRALAADAADVKRQFLNLWRRLRPRIIGRQAAQPRIWET